MRLLTWNSQSELILTSDLSHGIPPYAILSHTWAEDNTEEVTWTEVETEEGRGKPGYKKIRFCAEQARRDDINHFWIDTCCINKANHVELSEAITSMFRWYHDAQKCYVYLSDVAADNSSIPWESSFPLSRWFTRGWTLQELLAPTLVEFYSCDAKLLGTKASLVQLIHDITTIPLAALQGTPVSQFSVAERIRWTEGRNTTKKEDKAYCLLGIFSVFMSFMYGEGDNALLRLRNKINKQFGGDVARFGQLDNTSSVGSPRTRVPPVIVHDAQVRASRLDQVAGPPTPDESCLTRQLGEYHDMTLPDLSSGRAYDPIIQTQQSSTTFQGILMSFNEDRVKALLKSLQFDRMTFRVDNVKKALLSTCQWLFHNPVFQKWHRACGADEHSGFLWIKGKPGCGKSTLMKTALEWTRRQVGKSTEHHAIISYFFNARVPASFEKSSLGLYRVVLYQLLSSHPPLQVLFTEKFATKDPGPLGEQWKVEELQDFLYDVVESSESFVLCLFIDALDEAESESDVRQMISFFAQLSDRALAADGFCRVQICLSSRHYPHISIGRGQSLVVEEQSKHRDDIEIYIAKELTCVDGPERDELCSELLKKSAGIFLWVVLVVAMLNKLDDCGASLSVMRIRLSKIPAGLDELFKGILDKNEHGIETSILLFQWMAFCMRPIEPAELLMAMKYSTSPHHEALVLPDEHSVLPSRLSRFILNCSRGLVEIVGEGPSEAGVIQFIHETVREFLLSKHGLASIDPTLATNIVGTSHEMLRAACLRCISMNDIPPEYIRYYEGTLYEEVTRMDSQSRDGIRRTVLSKQPFLEYAIFHLFSHAQQAQQNDISQQAFLAGQMYVDGTWMNIHRRWWNVQASSHSDKVKAHTTLLYILIERRHWDLVRVLPGISTTVNTSCGWYGNALQAASVKGNEETVKLLISKGADVNAHGGQHGSALTAAAGMGHEKIVQILLDGGMEVDMQRGHFGTALQAAAYGGNEKIVQMLLNRGANVDMQGGPLDTALKAAAYKGHKNIVRILTEVRKSTCREFFPKRHCRWP